MDCAPVPITEFESATTNHLFPLLCLKDVKLPVRVHVVSFVIEATLFVAPHCQQLLLTTVTLLVIEVALDCEVLPTTSG